MKSTLIIMPFDLPWDHTVDYAHQTAAILANDQTVVCYLYKEAKSVWEYLQSKHKKLFWEVYGEQLLYYPLYILPFRRIARVEQWNARLSVFFFRISLFWRLRHVSFQRKILWIFDPECFPFMRNLGRSYEIVYDCVDYHAHRNAKEEAQLLREATYCFANSHVLEHALKSQRPDTRLVPQGFRYPDFKQFHHAPDGKTPVIGYVGGINERIDFPLLIALVRSTPNYRYEFIGPIQNHDKASFDSYVLPSIKKLFSFSNVRHISNAKKSDIPLHISQMDVGIIPYRTDMLYNKFSYPAKLFEYFYAGLPVISTDIVELQQFPLFVRRGSTSKIWRRHLQQVLSSRWPHAAAQRRSAKENSWEKKISAINTILGLDRIERQ